MSARGFIALGVLSIFGSACQQDGGLNPTAPSTSQPALAAGNTNGAAGQMPAYYDDELFTVNMKEQPAAASASIIAPLWHQILIVFNPGFTPHQFFSDTEVEAAAEGPNPEITLVETDEVYRCSVVGRK